MGFRQTKRRRGHKGFNRVDRRGNKKEDKNQEWTKVKEIIFEQARKNVGIQKTSKRRSGLMKNGEEPVLTNQYRRK